MGNDGGYIATRVDLVKNKQKEIKIDHVIKAKNRAKLCQLSKERLKKPIAMCRLGNLYNYEQLLTHMMNKTMPKVFSHIKKIKHDVKQINMPENVDKDSENPFMCSLSKIEFNGINKFYGSWECGCVFSAKLVENITDKRCPVCSKKYSSSDLVNLTMTDEQQKETFIKIMEKMKKKEKKKADKEEKEEGKTNVDEPKIVKKVKREIDSSVMLQKPKMALIEKLSEQDNKIAEKSEVLSSLFHKNTGGVYDKDTDNLMFRNTRNGIR